MIKDMTTASLTEALRDMLGNHARYYSIDGIIGYLNEMHPYDELGSIDSDELAAIIESYDLTRRENVTPWE